MAQMKLGEVESRFADLIWKNEPVSSRRLSELAEEALGWKRTTTYTVLKRLCDRGLFRNESGRVTSLVSRSEFYALQSEKFVEETFDGSLPAFVAAFTRRGDLRKEDIDALQAMIDRYRKEADHD